MQIIFQSVAFLSTKSHEFTLAAVVTKNAKYMEEKTMESVYWKKRCILNEASFEVYGWQINIEDSVE